MKTLSKIGTFLFNLKKRRLLSPGLTDEAGLRGSLECLRRLPFEIHCCTASKAVPNCLYAAVPTLAVLNFKGGTEMQIFLGSSEHLSLPYMYCTCRHAAFAT
ncbi:unnamed protein product [Ixodes persulcatus]